MSNDSAWRLLELVAGYLGLLGGLGPLVLTLPYLTGMSFVHARRAKRGMSLTALDPGAMAMAWFPLSALAVWGFMAWGFVAGCLTAAAAGLLWFSCRINVAIVPGGTTLWRTVLWFIPWRVMRSTTAPALDVDGWGDWADPEALSLHLDQASIELAWSGAGSGERATRLAEAINAKIRAAREISA